MPNKNNINIVQCGYCFYLCEKELQAELAKMEMVRNYFIDNGVFDKEGLNDYINHEQGN